MRQIMTKRQEVDAAIASFRQRIASMGIRPTRREWIFPNGERSSVPTFSLDSHLGKLLVGLPEHRWSNRLPHFFQFDRTEGPLVPEVELNIPAAVDRKVSGVYVRDGEDIWLCTRGFFNAYRGRIPRVAAFRHFDKWLIDVTDGDRSTRVIPVVALHSPSLADNLAEFVEAVHSLKSSHKAEGGSTKQIESAWREGAEFEGSKTLQKTAGTLVYDYLHGPLCNSLLRTLREITEGSPRYAVRRNQNIDAALVDLQVDVARAIFEVKTSSALSAQLYSAVGQLLYYRHSYGNPASHMFLVLPQKCIEDKSLPREFFQKLGVTIIVEDAAAFRALHGTTLSDLIMRLIRV